MSGNPFNHFQRAAEAAGYPALLLVTMASLAIMVDAVVLLAVMQSGWAFAVSMLSLIAALALLWGGINASFSESDDADDGVAMREDRHVKSPEQDREAA
jgi:hypothetical protein